MRCDHFFDPMGADVGDDVSVNNSPVADWDFVAENAAHADAAGRAGNSWIPPILGALVEAARVTRLARFFPFTSHHRFCLSDGPEWWVGDGQVAPAFIALDPEDGYIVWKGSPYDAAATVAVTTGNEGAAAAGLERLLDLWPESAP